jgi:hypothetical protein
MQLSNKLVFTNYSIRPSGHKILTFHCSKKNMLGLHSAHQFEQEKKRGRSGAYLLLDAEVSGKKRGAAVGPGCEQERGRGEEEERSHHRGRSRARPVVVGEEEGRWLRGEEEGRRLSSSSGKKRGGGFVVVG